MALSAPTVDLVLATVAATSIPFLRIPLHTLWHHPQQLPQCVLMAQVCLILLDRILHTSAMDIHGRLRAIITQCIRTQIRLHFPWATIKGTNLPYDLPTPFPGLIQRTRRQFTLFLQLRPLQLAVVVQNDVRVSILTPRRQNEEILAPTKKT
ncbi:hypothetical protein CC1G_15769 [Coprinopsis cinerea okayama7|uniref:Uncharacterized protein n=1 Tax=Coprinopsis cinerea (strain Okayama-7 / 130 / ATCC MYA-4618 / FGSC 9003) TaxID=240176 RepID=D6RQY3_COPC7|nr:hypothetical protein CC1G_15769 [Coprinopsis cinerea okayama7\|eukprot:XP_002910050.1 hypothetical protein CC1G_15769 [Coprinopsis cinerea okayama7\